MSSSILGNLSDPSLFGSLSQEEQISLMREQILLNQEGQEAGQADLQLDANNFFLVVMGIFIFFMQAGFALLEAGSVRIKNTTNILLKVDLLSFPPSSFPSSFAPAPSFPNQQPSFFPPFPPPLSTPISLELLGHCIRSSILLGHRMGLCVRNNRKPPKPLHRNKRIFPYQHL